MRSAVVRGVFALGVFVVVASGVWYFEATDRCLDRGGVVNRSQMTCEMTLDRSESLLREHTPFRVMIGIVVVALAASVAAHIGLHSLTRVR